MSALEAENSQLRERMVEMDARMRQRVEEVQAERDRALTDRERLMALVEKLTTAPPPEPFWWRWFGHQR